jgi:hypothetical protein
MHLFGKELWPGDYMLDKDELKKALLEGNSELIQAELKKKPALLRKIQRSLYDTDERVRWAAARAYGDAALVLGEEKMKDILRRLVWMINEESGNNCWFAPHAIGYIGKVRPEWVEDFIPCLLEFYEYPDSKIREGLEFAFNLFREAGLNVPED